MLPVSKLKFTGTYLYRWADKSTFLFAFFRYTCHEIVPILEEEDAFAAIFTETNDGCASEEDSADEDDGSMIDNLTGSQLNAPTEALLSDGRRITGPQDEESNEANDSDQVYKELQ